MLIGEVEAIWDAIDLADDVGAVHVRQGKIEDDELGLFPGSRRDRILTGRRDDHLMGVCPQSGTERQWIFRPECELSSV